MKKAILAALCFILVSCMFVNGTFAMPNFNEEFKVVAELLDNGAPKQGGEGTAVHVTIKSDEATSQLFPGGTATRTSRVMNEGTGDVFFRFAYAVQYCDEASWNKLTIDFQFSSKDYTQSDWLKITVDGETYMMKVFTYATALGAEKEAPAIEISVGMAPTVTSQEIARYRSNFLMMQVMAIEAQPFIDKAAEKATKDTEGKPQVDVPSVAKNALEAALPLATLNPF